MVLVVTYNWMNQIDNIRHYTYFFQILNIEGDAKTKVYIRFRK